MLSLRMLQTNEMCVVRLAQTIDQQQDWDALPMLADAMEEAGAAGWEAEHAMAHLRSGHPRELTRCYAVEAILSDARRHRLIAS